MRALPVADEASKKELLKKDREWGALFSVLFCYIMLNEILRL